VIKGAGKTRENRKKLPGAVRAVLRCPLSAFCFLLSKQVVSVALSAAGCSLKLWTSGAEPALRPRIVLVEVDAP
jgi:hypothetical protein